MSKETLGREKRENKSSGDQHKWTQRFVYRGSVLKNPVPVEEATKARSTEDGGFYFIKVWGLFSKVAVLKGYLVIGVVGSSI
jgi:hypothetical protein